MAHDRPISDWEPLWFFPWVETRRRMAFLDTDPRIPLDLVPSWSEWRWRTKPTTGK